MASRGDSRIEQFAGIGWSFVDAPDVSEDVGLLMRLRANNDALESLRQALDEESQVFARFIRRDPDEATEDAVESVVF